MKSTALWERDLKLLERNSGNGKLFGSVPAFLSSTFISEYEKRFRVLALGNGLSLVPAKPRCELWALARAATLTLHPDALS